MYKGYKVRLYPTKEQEELIWKHIHACRFIWNYMLEYQIKNREQGNRFLSTIDMRKLLSPLKKQEEYKWLTEVSNKSLELKTNDLGMEFARYYRHLNSKNYIRFTKSKIKKSRNKGEKLTLIDSEGFPKYKSSKKSKLSYPVRADVCTFVNQDYIKIEKLGLVKVKVDYKSFEPGKMYNIRITYVNEKWILSFAMKYESQVIMATDIPMGIDLGIKELAVVSFGGKKLVYHNINNSKRIRTLEHKLKHIQKVRDRKMRVNKSYERTNSIMKYLKMEQEIYYKLSNIRNNYILHMTHELISLKPNRIVMENLNISEMRKNKYVSKKILDQKLGTILQLVQYKCEWNGIEFIKADRFYPSSKTYSNCGTIRKHLKLSDRIYSCPRCGLKINRDYNAAINLMRYVPPTER